MYKNKKVIYIYGASGAGSTTLGEHFARKYNGNLYDTDIYFHKHYNEHQLRMDSMMEDIRNCDKDIIVITGSFWNWQCDYKEIITYIDCYVRVMLDTEIRMNRLRKREKERYGERIEEGGDLYEINRQRLKWAEDYEKGGLEMRSLKAHINYERLYKVSPLIVDSKNSIEYNVEQLARKIFENSYTNS